jgi:hypothetical protein
LVAELPIKSAVFSAPEQPGLDVFRPQAQGVGDLGHRQALKIVKVYRRVQIRRQFPQGTVQGGGRFRFQGFGLRVVPVRFFWIKDFDQTVRFGLSLLPLGARMKISCTASSAQAWLRVRTRQKRYSRT